MLNQNEESEIFVEKEQLSKTPVTPDEFDEKNKDKKEKRKGVFKSEWLNKFNFLKEYKPDKSQVTCMACNSPFNVHYGGKTDVVQHSKNK
jgi:hypothetical protein